MIERIQVIEEIQRRKVQRKLLSYFPDTGPLRRELYPKHTEFFRAGADHRERLALAANRVGKSEGMGGYEMALHLTGIYPEWWEGRRFAKAIVGWAAGDTGKTVRDILQMKMLGPVGSFGTGLIPAECIVRIVRSAGLTDAVETVYVRHLAGGVSMLQLKSYEQGRQAFQGTAIEVIWLDEEPPMPVKTECLLRTMTCDGLLMLTFTPLMGMSEVVLEFLPEGKMHDNSDPSKYTVMATWDDAPHLSQEAKEELWKSLPPHQRDARSKGIPQLGSGAIYPVPESDLIVSSFALPPHWPQGYGMDVGWNCTAAVFGAYDREHDTVYLTHEYKRSQAEPAIHVAGIKAPGAWLPGFIDPASKGRSQKDGTQLLEDYRKLGLRLHLADNGVESGLYAVWNRMSTGRLKVFTNMVSWLTEFRLYRRDEKGNVVKQNDHLMDCTRYLESRVRQMIVKPVLVPIQLQNPARSTVWG